jgi:GTPase SAR1 family protein
LIFDLTNRNSFERLASWLEDIFDYGPKDVNILLIGNKSDLADDRTVTFNDAYNFSNKYNIPYLEVSAKTGNNVTMLFENLTRVMVQREQELDKKRKKKGKIDKSHVVANKSITLENGKMEQEINKKNKCC